MPTAAPDRSTKATAGRPPRRLAIDPYAALLSVILAAFTVLGASYHATDSAAWFASSPGAVLAAVLCAFAVAALLYLVLAPVCARLGRREAEPAPGVLSMAAALRRWLLPTTAVLLLGWLPWLVIHYPGGLDGDTVTQLFQWRGLLERTNHHPWFDTMVFGLFWDAGSALGDLRLGLFAYLLLQELATAAGLALAIAYLGRLGMPRGARRALTVAVAVVPVFPLAASVMSKDALAAVFWMPFLVLFVEAVRTRALVLRRPWAAAGLLTLAALLILTKRTNLYLVLACALVLLVVAVARARLPLAAGAALVVVLTGVVWPAAVLQPLGVKPGTGVDILTIPVQQTARTVLAHGDDLAPEERDAIDAVLRYDGLAEAYDPRRSDRVKGRWNLEATTEQKLAYARTWLGHLVRYPGTYLSATAANTYEYFAPLTPLSFQQELNLSVYVDYWLDRSVPGTTRAEVEAVALALDEPPALDDARAAANEIQSALGEHAFVAAKALYCSWIPLLALAVALRRRDALLAIATIPLFVNLAFLVASPVALPRYTIPLIYGAVLVVGLMLTPVRRLRAVPRRRRRRDAPASQTSAL